MITVKDVFAHLDKIAPVDMKMGFDNVGHLVGRGDAEISTVLVALDITDAVITEAIGMGAELIVAHHPIIMEPLRQVTDNDPKGRNILKLIRHDIAAICMHTNLDAARGGVNDVLADILGLSERTILCPLGEWDGVPYGLGRVGTLPVRLDLADFMAQVKEKLDTRGIRYHDAGLPVCRVAVMGGSGSDMLQAAADVRCDTYVVGEAKYHAFLEAQELGMNLIEADHYCTENVISVPLRKSISEAFPEIRAAVSERHEQAAQFY